jgi:hypothetical protein
MFKKTRKIGLYAFLVVSSFCCAYGQSVSPNAAADLKPHPHSSDAYNEFWTYHFYFENNMKVLVNYSRVNAGSFKGKVCGADITVVNFEGKNYRMAREMPVKNFKFSPETSRLRIHDNIWFEGNLDSAQTVMYKASKKGVSYDVNLHIHNIAKTLDRGREFSVGGEKAGMFIHIPYAQAEGTVSINGKEIYVKGTVYMDHTYGTNTVARLFHKGFRYIQHGTRGDFEVGYFLDPRKSKSLEGYAISSKSLNGSMLEVHSLKSHAISKARSREGIRKWAEEMSFVYSDGSQLNVTSNNIYAKNTVLDEFRGVTRWVVRKFLGGNVLNFMGEGTVNQKSSHYSSFYVKK